jgi:ribosome-associated translation inhibitor RaiA
MIEPTITYRGMEHSAAMDARIADYAAKLEDCHPKITRCHVIVDERDRRKTKGNHFEVRIDIHVPGREIVASRKEHEDPYVAMHVAFEVVYRQLEEDIQKKRGDVKRHQTERGDDSAP